MQNLKKKKLVILIFLGIALAIILVASANIDATEIFSEEANNNAEMTPQSSGITYKDVYTVGRWFEAEYKVVELDALGSYNMGKGVFHIRGYPCALWDTSTTRANMVFGFNNPYFEESGKPISFEILGSIRFRNWNDDNGYVKILLLHDWGVWVEFWARTGLRGDYTFPVDIDLAWPVTEWYTRGDGSMDIKVVGCTWVDDRFGYKPSCKVNINDLRVQMEYNEANLRPVGEVYSTCQYYTPEHNVVILDGVSGSNTGDGMFHVKGAICPWTGSSTTRARLNFGFNNPVYSDLGLPTQVEVKCDIRFKNWNDHNGYVKLYALRDDGTWGLPIWEATGLTGGTRYFPVSKLLDSNYFRNDGSMSLKVVGTSWITNKWPEQPSCQVNVYDLRVKLLYPPKAVPGGPYSGNEGESITLDASSSSDPTGNTLWYRWDFDNNGIWDTIWSTNPIRTHAWKDDYSGNIRLLVSNGGSSDIHTTQVDIQNVAPTIDLGPDRTVDEGVIDLSSFLTINDPGSADTHTMEWDYGDGSPPSTSSSHTFDDGIYTVSVKVTDDDGGEDTDSFVITVNNVDPLVDLGPDRTVYEGYYVTPTIIDPGPDTHTYEWDLGDGTIITTPTLRLNDDGIYAITVTVTDDDGGVGTDSLEVTVNNVAPIVILGSDKTVNEGYYAHPFIIDPGWGDTFTYRWDLGGGTIITTPYLRFNDDGIYSVTLTVTDDDGGVGTDSYVVTVNNVAPTVHAGPDQTVNEGQNVHFHGSFGDLGWDFHYYYWNFGDGTPIIPWTLIPSHTYIDNGVYTVTMTVIDDDGGVGSDTLTVTVNNVAPVVNAGDDQTVDEGQIVSVIGTFTDAGSADTHTILWDFGDGSLPSALGSHVYADNGDYTVTMIVTHDDNGVGSDTLIVSVNNVAPTVDAGDDQTIDQGDEAIFSVSFTDPGSADTHTVLWDFGDGSLPSALGSHVYLEYGTYTVTLTVTDDDGGVGSDTLIVDVRDITDPITTLTFQPQFGAGPTYYVSTTTEFVLTAEDNLFGSGIDIIQYRIGDDSEWITYDEPFSISEIGGPYTVYYRSIDKAENVETEKSVDVIVNASELTYLGGFEGTYSDPVNLEAYLIDIATQEPISGKTIVFTIGTQTVTAETELNGVAYATLILDQIPGDYYIVSASFVNDGEYLASYDESAFTINKERAYAEYTGDMVVPLNADTITLRATVFDEDDGTWGDLTKIYVTITILDSMTLIPLLSYTYEYILQVETTGVEGVGRARIIIDNDLPEGDYIVQISFDPDENDYYCGDNSYNTLIIYEPTGDFVTGGGWIEDENGNKGNFGFNVKYKKNGLPKGQAIYIYREGDYVFIVKANAWVGMAIIPDDNYAIFEAKCNVKQVNAITGEIVWEEGNYQLIIEVWDNSQDGKEDVIQIRVRDKIGLIYHEAGFDPYGYLMGGNIVIHIDKIE